MFTTSFWLWLWSVMVNIVVPLIPGVLFLRLCFGAKFKGVLLYLLGWFIGVGVISNFLFDVQFIHFGVGIVEYVLLLVVLVIGLVIKHSIKKWSRSAYLQTLRVVGQKNELISSYTQLTPIYKLLTWGGAIAIVWFLAVSFIFTTNFPTYADDSFSNWNRPVANIVHDGGVKLFWAKDVILARGRLGYPIHIAIYEAVIADFTGGINDVYIDLFQRISMFFCLLFVMLITREKSKNIVFTLAPAVALISLPLIFIHSIESYHDLPVTIFAVIAAWAIYEFLSNREGAYLTLWLLIVYIMSYIKIEWLIIYAGGLFFAAVLVLLLDRKVCKEAFQSLRSSRLRIIENVTYFVLFLLPFQLVRMAHHLGFNPSSLESGEVLDKKVHREIFSNFKWLFFKEDNYWIALIPLCLLLITAYHLWKQKKYVQLYFIIAGIFVFVLFTLVFLLTNNYQWVLNQTTVNRVYTMCFFMIFAFIWFYMHERWTK